MSNGTASVLTGSQPPCAAFCDFTGVVYMGDWTIKPFPVEHDAIEPIGFLIFHNVTHEKIVYMTDTGFTKYVPVKPTQLIIECSYCEDILERNRFTMGERYLRMKQHHFGLNRTKQFLEAVDRSTLASVVLVHLSATNSDSLRMKREVGEIVGNKVGVYIAEPQLDIDLSAGKIL